MTSNKINAKRVELGIRLDDIGKSLSPPVGKSQVSKVISGRSSSPRVRKAIAKHLKLPYAKIWGSAA